MNSVADAGAGGGHDEPGVRGAVPPRSALEARLLEIWWDVLDEDRIGVTDDFFYLGGDSLGAVKLLGEIELRLGCRLPLSSMIESSTIARQAELLGRQDAGSSWPSLVTLQAHGTGTPVALVADASGHVLLYRPFARYLGLASPVYALQAQGLDGVSPVCLAIEDLARHNVRELRESCPRGPYVLAGYSFGGLVAFEMAQQLTRAGLAVPLLVILDAHRPTAVRFVRRHVSRFMARGLRTGLAHVLDGAVARRRAWTAARRRDWHVRHGRPVLLANETMQAISDEAALRYDPRPYSGRVMLVEGRDPCAALWRGLLPRGVEVHRIDCEHLALMREPAIRVVADLVRTAILTATASSSP